MPQGGRDSAVGNTIKLEDYLKLPDGIISAGVATIENTRVVYVVYKHSALDWNIYTSRWKEGKTLIDNLMNMPYLNNCTKLTNQKTIKSLFNCSKQVMKLLTI